MHVGAKFRLREQPFECTGSFEHIVPARCVTIYRLEARCPDCGDTFATTGTKTRIHKRDVQRRCPDCRQPGVPVGRVKNTKRASARRPKGKRKALRGSNGARPSSAPVTSNADTGLRSLPAAVLDAYRELVG